MGTKHTVIVVGGGISGLSAAYRLKQAGHQVKVLEGSERVGGKMSTLRRDGYLIERGGTLLPARYDAMFDLIREVGMADQVAQAGSVIGYAKGSEMHYIDSARLYLDTIGSQLLSWRSKLNMVKVALDARKIGPFVNYENLSQAAAFDTESCADYARRRVNPELAEYIIDATMRGMVGAPGAECSIVDFFFAFSRIIGSSLHYLRGGMDTLPQRLADVVGNVQVNARVQQVEDRGATARVCWTDATGQEHQEDADACVVALDAHHTAEVLPQLDDWSLRFLRGLRYTGCINMCVGLRQPPAGNRAAVIEVPASFHPDLMSVTLEHNKTPDLVPAGKGAMTIFGMSDWSLRHMDSADDSVRDKLLAMVAPMFPGLQRDIDFVEISRWPMVIRNAQAGDYQQLATFWDKRQQLRSVYLAGDYFASSNMNTAATAGWRAARDISARVA